VSVTANTRATGARPATRRGDPAPHVDGDVFASRTAERRCWADSKRTRWRGRPFCASLHERRVGGCGREGRRPHPTCARGYR